MTLSAVKEMLLPILRERFLPEQIEYLYGFVATGGQYMIQSWLNKPQREPPETIAVLIEAAVSRL